MKVWEGTGFGLGVALSPLASLVSALRGGRMVHSNGALCEAVVEPLALEAQERAVARRLEGAALVRWSAAFWKRRELPDLLGCAVRFTQAPLCARAYADDQDLLLATVQRPWSAPAAMIQTEQHEFLSNYYYSVSPFRVEPLGEIEWRVRPEAEVFGHGSRNERVLQAVAQGAVSCVLEWAPYAGALRHPSPDAFRPLVRLRLLCPSAVDERELYFNPFRCGRQLRPYGFVHQTRRATYAGSQAARGGRGGPVRRRKYAAVASGSHSS